MFTPCLALLSSADGTFLHWMLAIAITLIILDVFLCTEWLSCLSLFTFAAWGTWRLDLPTQWSVLVFLFFLGIGIAFYFTCWRGFIRNTIAKTLLRNTSGEQINSMVDRAGIIIGNGDSACVKVQDELYPITDDCREILHEGDQVVITDFKEGVTHVARRSN